METWEVLAHQWYIKYSGSSTWTYLGNSSNVTQTFYQSYQTHQLKLVINSNGQSAEDLYTLVVWGSGFKTSVDTKQTETEQVPEEFDLHHNYPNPFNPSTKIMYSLPEASSVSLVIYNLTGSEVTRWTMANDQAGYKSKIWNGTDVNGKRVPAGMYIYKLTARSLESNQVFTQSHKMVLMK